MIFQRTTTASRAIEGHRSLPGIIQAISTGIASLIIIRSAGNSIRNLTNGFNSVRPSEIARVVRERSQRFSRIKVTFEAVHRLKVIAESVQLANILSSHYPPKTHPLAQPKGITLSTVHTMKGQEYDIVFLMGMDDETFPDYRAIRAGGPELKQEKNNAYVAFTRSKRFLYVTWPERRLMPWGDYKFRDVSRFLRKLI